MIFKLPPALFSKTTPLIEHVSRGMTHSGGGHGVSLPPVTSYNVQNFFSVLFITKKIRISF